ncbi:hypothetical protein KIPB_017118 [Kipferlia bialata]|uniref:Uncharacterized protein n=1 Tax=Kipferlia bialata TaxID=797122 RepID=A0A391NWF4_9EUKA|nr:hypothetical protein KIPB_017118 [Kipferlia bialata]|eukprot:g17118.t1
MSLDKDILVKALARFVALTAPMGLIANPNKCFANKGAVDCYIINGIIPLKITPYFTALGVPIGRPTIYQAASSSA